MKILIIGGGHPDTWPNQLADFDFYIGVDRGSLYLLQAGLPLDLAVGDFDSLTESERNRVFTQSNQYLQAPAQKDDTDTQLALLWATQHYPKAQYICIGLTGGRMDHFLANLWMVLEPRFTKFANQIHLLDRQNTIQFYLPGEHTIYQAPSMKYLAYVCLTPMQSLSLYDSKYTLNHQKVTYPISYASNEFLTDTARVAFSDGILAVIQSKDA